MILKKLCYALLLLLLFSCNQNPPVGDTADYNIVPQVQEISLTQGNGFILSTTTKISSPAGNEKLNKTAELLAGYIE
ncbi:MAG: hypothetical protein ACK5M3_12835 [Dysgonomonas sp.]